MTYTITASAGGKTVEQTAPHARLMKLWLQAFRRNGWTVGQVTETK